MSRYSGAQQIDNERTRQITEEGWSAAHDDEHTKGELAMAAACYASYAALQIRFPGNPGWLQHPLSAWPWDIKWWKPSEDPIVNLRKAGDLDAAEIDRLERLKASGVSNG